ncbi:hypothetical protein TRIUR3_17601 [Triticum urartu]|uniref:Uncharacterized protein n=1 Tax=Triticum urartu TaxID=4572 RepID=M8A1T0_TRIUA|nr:hypothetical protein TRIUR3_17601 [Triticum urartu]
MPYPLFYGRDAIADAASVFDCRSTDGVSGRIIGRDKEYQQPEDDGGEEPRQGRDVAGSARHAVSFGYDLKSYSRNFDDGLVPAHHL